MDASSVEWSVWRWLVGLLLMLCGVVAPLVLLVAARSDTVAELRRRTSVAVRGLCARAGFALPPTVLPLQQPHQPQPHETAATAGGGGEEAGGEAGALAVPQIPVGFHEA